MKIRDAAKSVLSQLSKVISHLDGNDYSRPIPRLGNSTIGQHVRHTIEFFICMKEGISKGIINYDSRSRDLTIEKSPDAALAAISAVLEFLNTSDHSADLNLEIDYGMDGHAIQTLRTNFDRELAYNIEHAIHHMAILKIGIKEISPDTNIPEGFGIAVSTLRYRKEQVQLT